MPDDIEIRQACVEDWEVIAEFNCQLALETENKQLDRSTIERGVRGLLGNAMRGRYFVAVTADHIVGQLMHTFEWSDWRCGEIWWLQSVYVRPDFRRRGVFRRLYQHVEQQAQACPDVVGLRLYVEDHNQHAHETYGALGMIPAGYSVLERLWVTLPITTSK